MHRSDREPAVLAEVTEGGHKIRQCGSLRAAEAVMAAIRREQNGGEDPA